MYKKKLDEILIGKERLNMKEFREEEKVGMYEHGLPKKMCDPRNYVLPVKFNGVVEMIALVDTRARVSVLPYSLYKDLGLSDLRPYQMNLKMVDNTQAKEMGEVKNLPLLLGRPFLRTRAAIVDMGRGMLCVDDGKSHKDTLLNPLIAEYERRNKRNTITYSLQPVSNANLKRRDLSSVKRHAYYEKLSKLQERSFGVPKVANWRLFDGYGFEDTLREMMKLEYIYEGDGDIFVDYSWERALSIDNEIYPEWVLEFFSTLYFDKDVDRNNLMKEKCIWFRLCGHEHILTLPEFAVVLGLFTEDEVKHHLFEVYFGRLEVGDKQFDHKDYWTRVGKPTLTNHKEVLVKEPLMRIVHKVIIGSLVHRVANDEIKKFSELIDCEYWISKILADELDVENTCLTKETKMPTQAKEGSSEPRQEHGRLNSSWGGNQRNQRGSYGLGGDDYFTSAMPDFGGSSSGYAVGGSSRGAGFNDDDDMNE
ncbi:retrovirus-related pol polyprotein from transposon TNT 1-94 [Tanacetum coccineum]